MDETQEDKTVDTVEPTAQPTTPTAYDHAAAAVDKWFSRYINNSPASQNTEIYNHLSKAKDALKDMLKEAI